MFITWPSGCNDLDKSSYTPIVVTMVEAKMTEFAQSHELRCMSPVMVTPWPAASDTTYASINSESVWTGPVHSKPTCRNYTPTTCPQWHSNLTNILIYCYRDSHSQTRHTLRKHWNICGLEKHAPSRSARTTGVVEIGNFSCNHRYECRILNQNNHLFNSFILKWSAPGRQKFVVLLQQEKQVFECPTMHATNFSHYYTGLNSPVWWKRIVCLHYWYLTSSYRRWELFRWSILEKFI